MEETKFPKLPLKGGDSFLLLFFFEKDHVKVRGGEESRGDSSLLACQEQTDRWKFAWGKIPDSCSEGFSLARR